jgi:hypothetical protein
MIHSIRKNGGKQDSSVYGISTDSHDFVFWKLDDSGMVSSLRPIHLLFFDIVNFLFSTAMAIWTTRTQRCLHQVQYTILAPISHSHSHTVYTPKPYQNGHTSAISMALLQGSTHGTKQPHNWFFCLPRPLPRPLVPSLCRMDEKAP